MSTDSEEQQNLHDQLSTDLHSALISVPMSINYFDKLKMYGKKLIEDYNWRSVEVYSTAEELDALEVGTRVSTYNRSLAVKHATGWVVLTVEGYCFPFRASNTLVLPAYSIPSSVKGLRNGSEAT